MTVGCRLLSGAAQASADTYFTSAARTATIGIGESEAIIEVRVDGDAQDERDEAIVLEAFNPHGAGFPDGAPAIRATSFILEDDGAGANLALFASRPVIVEGVAGVRTATFEVALSRPAPVDLLIPFTMFDGSARAGEDYATASGTLSFPAGERFATVSVDVFGDATVEPSEQIILSLDAPAVVAEPSLGAATILDDDAGAPTVSVEGASAREATTSADPFFLDFAITLGAPALNAATVGYRLLSGAAQAGADAYFPSSARSVTFAPGETSRTVSIRVDSDGEEEPDEAVVLEIFDNVGAAIEGGGSTARATGFILDDDGVGNKLALFVSRPVVVEGDAGATTQANFEITLSRPAPAALAIPFTTVDGSRPAERTSRSSAACCC